MLIVVLGWCGGKGKWILKLSRNGNSELKAMGKIV